MSDTKPVQETLLPQAEDAGILTLKFETEHHSVDVSLAGNALLHLQETIYAFAKELPEIESLELTAVEQGSVELPVSIRFLKSRMGSTVIPIIRKWLSQLIKLYRLLNGAEPKKIEKRDAQNYIVTNSVGTNATFNKSVINVFNITNTSPVGDLSKQQDSDVKAISILDERKQIEERITREEYHSFAKRRKNPPSESDQTEEEDRTLILATIPILDPGKHQWGFEQDGFRFSAKVEDEAFLSRIRNRTISFQRGDSVQARILLLKRYDPQNGRYCIVKITITKILSEFHPQKMENGSLFLPESSLLQEVNDDSC